MEHYPGKIGITTLLNDVLTWQERLNKGETKLPIDEYKRMASWFTNTLKWVAEFKMALDELEGQDDFPWLDPETALKLEAALVAAVDVAGGIEVLPTEVKLQVAEARAIINDLKAEGEPEEE